MDNFGFKSFDNVKLKATYNIEIGKRSFQEGEVIAFFDKIQIANLNEIVERVSANGGFDNRPRVFWETTNEHLISFSQGVFNKEQLSLLLNSRIITKTTEEIILSNREYLESNEENKVELKYTPIGNKIFVYKEEDYSKIPFSIDENIVTINTPYTNIIVDYNFSYDNDSSIFLLGARYLNGFLELEGTTQVKDDTTGKVVTGVIKIPHLKLTSDLNIRLGTNANPIVANFNGIGVPVGPRGASYVGEFYLLNDDINSSI